MVLFRGGYDLRRFRTPYNIEQGTFAETVESGKASEDIGRPKILICIVRTKMRVGDFRWGVVGFRE